MSNYIQIGDRYGALTIIEDTGKRTKKGCKKYKCICDCGNIIIRGTDSIAESLIKGCVISCGCKRPVRDMGELYANDKKRLDNMRLAMIQVNGTTISSINRKNLNKNNKSGVRGVSFVKRSQKWRAQIQLRGETIGRKEFKDLEQAIEWRKYLELEYFKPLIKEYGKGGD